MSPHSDIPTLGILAVEQRFSAQGWSTTCSLLLLQFMSNKMFFMMTVFTVIREPFPQQEDAHWVSDHLVCGCYKR